ncbi:MAG: hypothetical protein GY715_07550 [Planctomycetes bacterium]|nr:hypothetical protein [Planctomycetota bacterium]
MNDTTSTDELTRDPDLEVEVLIGRLIDDEHTTEDQQRFEILADAEPALWRRLAQHHLDRRALAEEVALATFSAEHTRLPRRWFALPRLTWSMALSGWAAVLIMALSWGLVTMASQRPPIAMKDPAIVIQTPGLSPLSPEELLAQYLDAPWVLGEMQPVVLDVQEMTDGRIGINFMRRIEEVIFIAADEEGVLDENGELIADPATLRAKAPPAGFPN